MPKFKSNKEYALKLNHPEFGDFYFNCYTIPTWREKNFKFTKDLSKVKKWKTKKFVENVISIIDTNLKRKSGEIILMFGDEVEDLLKSKLVLDKKKYYHHIKFIRNYEILNKSKDDFYKIHDILILNSEELTKILKSENFDRNDFIEAKKMFNNNMAIHTKKYNILENNNMGENIVFNIVDASFGFRLLKLKNLKSVQEKREV